MKKTRIASLLQVSLTLMMAGVIDAAFVVTDTASISTADETTTPSTMDTTNTVVSEGRGHMKKLMLNPYMLIPQLITLGFAPIVLAKLKMMVVSAMMINNMALNAAIFMLIRNMVFGPRPMVKYANHGYDNHPNQYTHYDNGESYHDHHPHHDSGNYQHDHYPNQDSDSYEHDHQTYHRGGNDGNYQHDNYHLQHLDEQPSIEPENANYQRKRRVVVAS